MHIPIQCQCGAYFEVAGHLAGQQVTCPACRQTLWIPAGPPQMASHPYPAQPQYPAQWHQPQQKSGAKVGLIIVGVSLAVVLFAVLCAATVWFAARRVLENTYEQQLAENQQDYTEARRDFRTSLVRSGPSPQHGDPLRTPSNARPVSYRSGNLTLRAFVDPPREQGQEYPAVLFLHGGFAYGESDWEMAKPFRDAGFVVMTPVLRGENGQPGSFTLYYDEVDDVLAAAEALASLDYVDEKNVFVTGHSAGGTLAILAALTSSRFQAATSLSGAMNQTVMLDDHDLIVFDSSDHREIEMRSPESFAGSFKCPARLYYGNEESFLRPAIERTASRARGQDLDVQAEVVPGDHFSSVGPAIERSISFFREELSGGVTLKPPSSDPPPQDRTASRTTRPPFPTIPNNVEMPRVPFVPRAPSFPRGPASPSRAVVVFQVVSYSGSGDTTSAARRALAGVYWADLSRLQVDLAKNEIEIGVLGGSVSTGSAKAALERNGFQIGRTTYHGSGR